MVSLEDFPAGVLYFLAGFFFSSFFFFFFNVRISAGRSLSDEVGVGFFGGVNISVGVLFYDFVCVVFKGVWAVINSVRAQLTL